MDRFGPAVPEQRQRSRQGLVRCRVAVGGTEEPQDDLPVGQVAAGVVRDGDIHAVPVSGVEVGRLNDRDLDRRGDDHLLADKGVTHRRIMGEDGYIVCRQFVGSPEREGNLAVRIGTEERLEGQGILELLANRHIGSRSARVVGHFGIDGIEHHMACRHRRSVDGFLGIDHGRRILGAHPDGPETGAVQLEGNGFLFL